MKIEAPPADARRTKASGERRGLVLAHTGDDPRG